MWGPCSGYIYSIYVHPDPNINFGADTTLYWGDTLALTPQPNQTSYVWQNGSIQSSQLVGAPGTYAVTVTNSGGCQAHDSITVNFVPLCPAPISLGADTLVCNGSSISLDAGPGFATYAWSTGAATSTITTQQPGLYSVIALDSNQCAGLDTFAYLAPPLLNLPSQSLCAGDSQLLLVPPHYLHTQWANGVANDSLWVNQSGTYPLFVVDSLGCVQRDTAIVSLQPSPTLIAPNTYKCPGKTIPLQVAPAYGSYAWSNGSTNATTWAASPGLYLVSVVDTLGCAASGFTLLADYVVVPIDLGPDTSHCQTDSIQLLPQQPYVFYAWSDGSTLGHLYVSAVGTYHVAAIDANGCESHDTILVGIRPSPAAPLVSPPGPHTICAGQSISLQASPGYTSYLWSNGAAGPSASLQYGGHYFVAGFNQVGCSTRSASVEVIVDTVPQPSVVQMGTTIYCSDSGTAYQWLLNGILIPGATASSYAPLGPGNYSVMVFDNLGCSATSPQVFVFVPVGLTTGSDVFECLISPNPSDAHLFIRLQGLPAGTTIELQLYDALGRIILTQTVMTDDTWAGQFLTSTLPAGVYTLRLKGADWSQQEKILVQH